MIIVLVLHIVIAVFLVGMILVQKNEGGLGGLGGGSGSGGMGGFLAGRTQANLLTRTTAGLAAAFFVTSLVLAIMSTHGGQTQLVPDAGAPASKISVPAPAAPAESGTAPTTNPATNNAAPAPAAPSGGSTAPAPAAPAGQ